MQTLDEYLGDRFRTLMRDYCVLRSHPLDYPFLLNLPAVAEEFGGIEALRAKIAKARSELKNLLFGPRPPTPADYTMLSKNHPCIDRLHPENFLSKFDTVSWTHGWGSSPNRRIRDVNSLFAWGIMTSDFPTLAEQVMIAHGARSLIDLVSFLTELDQSKPWWFGLRISFSGGSTPPYDPRFLERNPTESKAESSNAKSTREEQTVPDQERGNAVEALNKPETRGTGRGGQQANEDELGEQESQDGELELNPEELGDNREGRESPGRRDGEAPFNINAAANEGAWRGGDPCGDDVTNPTKEPKRASAQDDCSGKESHSANRGPSTRHDSETLPKNPTASLADQPSSRIATQHASFQLSQQPSNGCATPPVPLDSSSNQALPPPLSVGPASPAPTSSLALVSPPTDTQQTPPIQTGAVSVESGPSVMSNAALETSEPIPPVPVISPVDFLVVNGSPDSPLITDDTISPQEDWVYVEKQLPNHIMTPPFLPIRTLEFVLGSAVYCDVMTPAEASQVIERNAQQFNPASLCIIAERQKLRQSIEAAARHCVDAEYGGYFVQVGLATLIAAYKVRICSRPCR